MRKEFEIGIAIGKNHLAKIVAMSDRWKNRNVPVFIRHSLLVSHYIVEESGFIQLFIIQYPIKSGDKVHFIPFARSEIDEKEDRSEVPDCEKHRCDARRYLYHTHAAPPICRTAL